LATYGDVLTRGDGMVLKIIGAAAIEVARRAAKKSQPRSRRREDVWVIAAPGAKAALVALPRLVAGRREVGGAAGDDGIDRLRDRSVLKHRLRVIEHVVDNDFCAGIFQRFDVVRERGGAVERPRERERSAGPAPPPGPTCSSARPSPVAPEQLEIS